jgi:hypothetical protein
MARPTHISNAQVHRKQRVGEQRRLDAHVGGDRTTQVGVMPSAPSTAVRGIA